MKASMSIIYQPIVLVLVVGREEPRTRQCLLWHIVHEYGLSPQPEPVDTNVKVKNGRLVYKNHMAQNLVLKVSVKTHHGACKIIAHA